MINLITFCIVLAVILYTAILYGSQALVFVFFCGSVFVIFAYGYLLYQYFQIDATMVVPIATAEKNQSVNIEIQAENKGKLPVLKLRYELAWKSFLMERKKRIFLAGKVGAGCTSRLRTKCQPEAAGAYQLKLEKIKIYDFTGIFNLSRKMEQEVSLQVLPEPVQINLSVGQASRHFIGESDVYDDAKGGHDPSEVFQIREFRAGDKIQSIHWKLSAKAEELMVRENSQPLGCPVILLADTGNLEKQGIQDAEHFLQLLYSISFYMVEQKCAHYIAWDCGKNMGIRRVRVENEEGLYLFLMEFFATDLKEMEQPQESLRQRYREKYKAETYITDVRIDSALEVFVNDSSIGKIEKENFVTECKNLELMV